MTEGEIDGQTDIQIIKLVLFSHQVLHVLRCVRTDTFNPARRQAGGGTPPLQDASMGPAHDNT